MLQQLAGVLGTFGVSEPTIARAIELGGSQAGIAEIIPARGAAARPVSVAQIEASGGMPADRIGELMEAFGLPLPAGEEPAFTPNEAQVLEQMWQLRDVLALRALGSARPHLRANARAQNGESARGLPGRYEQRPLEP